MRLRISAQTNHRNADRANPGMGDRFQRNAQRVSRRQDYTIQASIPATKFTTEPDGSKLPGECRNLGRKATAPRATGKTGAPSRAEDLSRPREGFASLHRFSAKTRRRPALGAFAGISVPPADDREGRQAPAMTHAGQYSTKGERILKRVSRA